MLALGSLLCVAGLLFGVIGFWALGTAALRLAKAIKLPEIPSVKIGVNVDRDIDKVLLTLGLLISVALVIFASKYDPTLTEWAKGICAGVFGAWLLALRQYVKNGNGNRGKLDGTPPNPA